MVSFALLDDAAQQRRLGRWGLVLAGSAGGAIRRIQWVQRTIPAHGDELARWFTAARDPSIPLRDSPIVESYLELLSSGARVASSHEILVAVQVDSARLRDRDGDTARALIDATEHITRGLEAADVSVLGALSRTRLARVLRTSFDPFLAADLTTMHATEHPSAQPRDVAAWPLATEELWDSYRCDGALHTTFWIGGWPRVDVSPMFMNALLGQSSAIRTVAVTFEPVAPERSARDVEAAVTRDHADRELRRRFGQSETVRQRQAVDAATRREAELAAGHAEVRLSGFVTVSGRGPDDVRNGTARLLEDAARAHIEVYRMYGQQAQSFPFTLPLARGLQ